MGLTDEEQERFSKSPILVGISNPWSSLPEHVLSPLADRPNCTGSRLLRLIQLHKKNYWSNDFLDDFPERFNLDDVGWDIIYEYETPRNFVLLGKVVAKAIIRDDKEVDRLWRYLDEKPPAFSIHVPSGHVCNHGIYVIPHPSGINRWYNDGNNKRAVGSFLWNMVHMFR